MDETKIKNRIQKLREEISKLQKEYHEFDNASVSDEVYDSLVRELRGLEKKNPEISTQIESPLERVGGKPLESFQKVKHEIRMTSLNDVFSEEEVADWEKRVLKILGNLPDGKDGPNSLDYFCELKLDGLSASLIYEKGIFVRGATRGDGFIGEDITENLKMIETVPLKLEGKVPDYIEIRGEIVMKKSVLEELNKKQEKLNKPIFANTRNAAAGSVRQLDPSIAKERKLDFFAWDIAKTSEVISKHSEGHDLLRKLGFQVSEHEKIAKNLDEVFDFIKQIEKERNSLPYGTDGLVISVNNLKMHDILGIVGKAPRYMVAYKYKAEQATTVITEIKVNVGRTGVLTPVAHFHKTLVAGSNVSKATLHNIDQIERLDIRIGDTVVIQKAGDVIPEVVEVLFKMRTGKEKKFKMPSSCPVCGGEVEQRKSGNKTKRAGLSNSLKTTNISLLGNLSARSSRPAQGFSENNSSPAQNSVAYYCMNKHCTARNSRSMQHFVNIFEIYEIGPKILDRLKDEGLISDSADLFTLEKADLSGLERFGEKSADNIISSIESHKKVLLWRFIYALGIIHVGEQTAQDLANNFNSVDKIIEASIEEINNIENIGPVVSRSIFEFFHDKLNINFINKLLDNGVVPYYEKSKNTKLKGNTFVLTGTLSSMSREEAKKKIIENGGSVSSSVSAKTNYLLAGEEPGSKYKEAQKLGVKILTEEEFLKML